jgi:hypothetical protein
VSVRAVLAEQLSVIRGDHDQRVLEGAALAQRGEERSEVGIETVDGLLVRRAFGGNFDGRQLGPFIDAAFDVPESLSIEAPRRQPG